MSALTMKLSCLTITNKVPTKFTGKIIRVTIDTKPPNLSPADKKAVEDAEDLAATIEE